MAEGKSITSDQIEQRGLGTDLAKLAVEGFSVGAGGVATTAVIGKLTGAAKPQDEPKKS